MNFRSYFAVHVMHTSRCIIYEYEENYRSLKRVLKMYTVQRCWSICLKSSKLSTDWVRELRLNKNIHITSRAQQDPALARAVAQLPKDPGPCPNVAATWTCWISSPYKVLPYMAWVGLTERWCCLIWIWSCFVSFPVCGFVQLYCARFWCPPRSFSCWEFRVRWKSPGIRQQEDSKSWRR